MVSGGERGEGGHYLCELDEPRYPSDAFLWHVSNLRVVVPVVRCHMVAEEYVYLRRNKLHHHLFPLLYQNADLYYFRLLVSAVKRSCICASDVLPGLPSLILFSSAKL